ncbi:MAG: hypothetical protein MUC88_17955, partial [Planctomycetes bacterium]|nr:hypothetical protein [Planctomycetota bacterium]
MALEDGPAAAGPALGVTASAGGDPARFEFARSGAGPGAYTLRANGAALEIVDERTGAWLAGTPAAGVSEIVIHGAAGLDDTLTVDFSQGRLSVPLTFHGGDGGCDTLIVAGGSFTAARCSARGRDAGRLVLDEVLLHYTGLEPIIVSGASTDWVFADEDGASQTIRLTDKGDPDDGRITIDSAGTGGFEEITFANPTRTLTIEARDGHDTIVLAALDDLFAAAIVVAGGDGDDTLIGPEAPNAWAITARDAGSLTARWANVRSGPVAVQFTGVENLTGGSAEDAFTFGAAASVTGTIDDGAGPCVLTVGQFVTLRGNYAFSRSRRGFFLSDGTSVDAQCLTLGASQGTVFVGSGGGPAPPPGFGARVEEFALAILTEPGGAQRTWYAVTGTLSNASFSGVDGLTLTAGFELAVNAAAKDGTVVDFRRAALAVETGRPTPRNIDFDGSAGALLRIRGRMEVDLFGLVLAYGQFSLTKDRVEGVNDGVVPTFDAQVLSLDLTVTAVFAGKGGAFTRDEEGVPDGFDHTCGAVGLYGENAHFALTILQDEADAGRKYLG